MTRSLESTEAVLLDASGKRLLQMTLPAGVHSQVEVENHMVDVAIQSQLLRLTSETLWYGASVQGRIVAR